jgi:hypothetical protein
MDTSVNMLTQLFAWFLLLLAAGNCVLAVFRLLEDVAERLR